jgi:U4/U6.U5 tri-snRNP component SNU23
MPAKRATGVDNTHRKVWNKEEYHQKAIEKEARAKVAEESKLDAKTRKRRERDPLHLGVIVERGKLKPRDREIDLTSNLGKTRVQGGGESGFYCSTCDCTLKDSLAYLDHINGTYHNRALGMSMEVERSTVEQVKKRLGALKRRKLGSVLEQESEAGRTLLLTGVDKGSVENLTGESEDNEQSCDDGQNGDDDRDEKHGEDDEHDIMQKMLGFGSFGGT